MENPVYFLPVVCRMSYELKENKKALRYAEGFSIIAQLILRINRHPELPLRSAIEIGDVQPDSGMWVDELPFGDCTGYGKRFFTVVRGVGVVGR